MRPQTFHKTLVHLTEIGFRAFFLICLAFAGLTALFNVWLALAEFALVLIVYLYLHSGTTRRKNEILAYLDRVTNGVDSASRRTMISSPLPIVIFRPDTDDIIWSNERFLHLSGDREHLFETKLSSLVPDFQIQWLLDGDDVCGEPVAVGDRKYLVYGNLVRIGDGGPDEEFLATTYWVDVTDYANTSDQFDATRPVLAIIQVDNYEDLGKGLDEGDRSAIRTQINNILTDWLEPAQGMIVRYDRDHFLFFMEAGKLADFYRRKFSILEEIRQVQSPNGVAATLSIGIGRNADTPHQLHEYASLALDMALSRGGDQVVIRDGADFSFIGGRSKETERRTKVKSRVVATALSDVLSSARQVIVMGHKFPDLDVIGSAAGVVSIGRKLKVPVKIVRAPSPNPAEVMTVKLASLPEYKGVFITGDEARHLASEPDTIVIVVDTNRPEQTQVPELLTSGAKVMVLDHHRRAASYIENPSLSFHDPYASSACELVTELVQYILDTGDLKKTEAEALLSGIVLDTKAFTMRTGSRTFETAAFLRKSGADTAEVKKLFQNGLEETVSKFEIIRGAKPYRKSMALALTEQKVGRAIAGQASDELLNIAGIQASFVLYPEDGQTCLSARSDGSINVQVISEMLGGGGNAVTAGAQFPGKTPQEVLAQLTAAIDKYFDEDE
ncbi:MAG: DHH family phosphoesterase [Ruminiclostridium sp.]|nr:DHH family phosphoesterase [Ruminiclostridium sp.]